MSEYTLTAQPALGGYQESFEGVALEELTDFAIVSIATPRGGEDPLSQALQESYGATIPKAGKVSRSEDGSMRFLGMSIDQMFAVFDYSGADAAEVIAGKLNDSGYCTLQSDNWVAMRISGAKCREALERICPIDLASAVFGIGSVARTSMEHMAVIIYPEDENTFVLITASSSAASFLHAVETSINNVI